MWHSLFLLVPSRHRKKHRPQRFLMRDSTWETILKRSMTTNDSCKLSRHHLWRIRPRKPGYQASGSSHQANGLNRGRPQKHLPHSLVKISRCGEAPMSRQVHARIETDFFRPMSNQAKLGFGCELPRDWGSRHGKLVVFPFSVF